MKFGLMFFASSEDAFIEDDKYHLVIESAKFADKQGFSSVWVPERHFTKFGSLYPNPAVLHAALARETQQIRLQAGSVVVPLHNPIRIAEEWAMVDNLSQGRIALSFASGWNPDDFAFFPDKYPNRHQEMYAGIETVQKLWRGESIRCQSGNGKPVDLRVYPTPVQKELPVWITAAGNPQTFSKAGELGANLLTHLLDQSIEELAEKIAVYRQGRANNGYDPQGGLVTVMLHTFVGEDMDIVREQVRIPYCEYLKSNIGLLKGLASSRNRDVDLSALSEKELDEFVNFLFERFASSRGLIGTPETCLNLLEQLDKIGVNEVACLLDFGPSADLILEHLPYLDQLKERYFAKDSENYSQPSAVNLQETRLLETQSLLEMPQKYLIEEIKTRCNQEIKGSEFYQWLYEHQVELEESFQGIKHLWCCQGEALGRVELPASLEASFTSYTIHPALLDSCNQVLAATLWTEMDSSPENQVLYQPVGLRSLRVYKPMSQKVWSHAILPSSTAEKADFLEGDIEILDDQGNLLLKISSLRMQKMQTSNLQKTVQPKLEDYLYQLRWQENPLPEIEVSRSQQPRSWLIFADSLGIGESLAKQLQESGDTCYIVHYGDAYQNSTEGHFWINPSSSQEINQLIEKILQPEKPPCQGIIHLWSVDATATEKLTTSSLKADQTSGFASALYLIQAMAERETTNMPVWFVTRGAQSVGSDSLSLEVAQSPLWGLGRVITMELPNIEGGLVDLDLESLGDEAAQQLINVLWSRDGENQIAFRQGQRYIPRLVRTETLEPKAEPLSLLPDATYLITGGLGGLGLKVAEWMVERGARNLVLVSRTGTSDHAKDNLKRLEQMGSQVRIASADVSDETQVARVLAEIEQTLPPLKGIIHLAGVLDDGLLVEQDWERVTKIQASKVEGAWNLHHLTQNYSLDFLVLFSSAASLVTLPGQGIYASANAFLDALAHYRKALNQPAISINWGPWSQIGHAATDYGRKAHENLARMGIDRIAPNQGVELLEQLLQQDLSQVGVMSVNWSQLSQVAPVITQSKFLSELMRVSTIQEDELLAGKESDILHQLRETPINNRYSLLISYIEKHLAQTLRCSSSELNLEKSLLELGLDSLMAVELRNLIKKDLAINIPIVKFMDDLSVVGLATYLDEELQKDDSDSSTITSIGNQDQPNQINETQEIPQSSEENLLSQIEQLSETEVDELLMAMLSETEVKS